MSSRSSILATFAAAPPSVLRSGDRSVANLGAHSVTTLLISGQPTDKTVPFGVLLLLRELVKDRPELSRQHSRRHPRATRPRLRVSIKLPRDRTSRLETRELVRIDVVQGVREPVHSLLRRANIVNLSHWGIALSAWEGELFEMAKVACNWS
jgi:hypothetical protein